MSYYMGVDIGTTAVKVVAFSQNGNVLAKHSQPCRMLHPAPDQSELNPDEVVGAIINCMNHVYNLLYPASCAFVSFSAAMHSLIAINVEGKLLTQCIIWADNRAVPFAKKLKNTDVGMKIYQDTGVPLHAMSPLCKLLWMQVHMPEVFEQAYKFIGIKDYFFYRLFNRCVTDMGNASATGLFNIHKREWDKQILHYAGISEEKMPEVVPVETGFDLQKNNAIAKQLQLSDKTLFFIGTSDGACANLSIGNNYKNKIVVTIGTSSAIRMIDDSIYTDAAMRTFCYVAKKNQYVMGGAGNNGAIVLEWLKKSLLQDECGMDSFLQEAAMVSPGCEGLLFLPYILGERAPIWNAEAKAVFFGLTVNHTKAHMIKAAQEAVIYSVFMIAKGLLEKKQITELYATGGFSRNTIWVQMLADVFNRKVILSGMEESSAWGAVTIGLEAMGKIIPSFVVSPATYMPDELTHRIYQKQLVKFERLTALLENEFTIF